MSLTGHLASVNGRGPRADWSGTLNPGSAQVLPESSMWALMSRIVCAHSFTGTHLVTRGGEKRAAQLCAAGVRNCPDGCRGFPFLPRPFIFQGLLGAFFVTRCGRVLLVSVAQMRLRTEPCIREAKIRSKKLPVSSRADSPRPHSQVSHGTQDLMLAG